LAWQNCSTVELRACDREVPGSNQQRGAISVKALSKPFDIATVYLADPPGVK